MPLLPNLRHERFAQALAQGRSQDEAYDASGYSGSGVTKGKIARLPAVKARVAELQAKAAARTEITAEMVLRELAKIGFSDIRMIVRWSGARPGDETSAADHTRRDEVEILASDVIDDDSAAAIAEVSRTAHGTVRLRLHDKRAALVDIGKHLSMFADRHGSTSGPVPWFIAGEPIENLDKWVERYKPKLHDLARRETPVVGAPERPAGSTSEV